MLNYAAVVLAAGKGKRMSEDGSTPIPKVMFQLLDKPIIDFTIANIKEAGINTIIPVVGYKKEMVIEHLGDQYNYAFQEEQLGSGHAVMMAKDLVENKYDGLLTCCGDTPLFRPTTIKRLIDLFEEERPAIAMLSTVFEDPTGYGRIVRDENGVVTGIREQKDCNEEEVRIKETSPGFFIFDNDWFWKNITKISQENAQHEYYLTEIIEIAVREGAKIVTSPTDDESEAAGINTQEQLKNATEVLKTRIYS